MQVLKPGDIAFDPAATPTADAIASAQASPTSSSAITLDSLALMTHLGKMAAPTLMTTGKVWIDASGVPRLQDARSENITDLLTAFIPYAITIGVLRAKPAAFSPVSSYAAGKIAFDAVPGDILREALVKHYDQDIAATGIFELCDIRGNELVSFNKIDRYLGTGALSMNDRQVTFTNNPYQSILTLPVADRPFLTGATIAATARDPSLQKGAATPLALPMYPITLKDMIAFARPSGLLAEVGQRFERYLVAKENALTP